MKVFSFPLHHPFFQLLMMQLQRRLLKKESTKDRFFFFNLVSFPCLSPVIQLVPGASAPAALPADHGRVALPVQALWQHREHHGRWRGAPLASRPPSLSESQVRPIIGKKLLEQMKIMSCLQWSGTDSRLNPEMRKGSDICEVSKWLVLSILWN